MRHNAGMPSICAIFTHYGSRQRSLTCLRRLAQQTRRPDAIVIINNSTADDPITAEAPALAAEILPANTLHLLQMPANLGNAGGCAHGMNYAFGRLHADYVWVLDDDSWPRPHSLENLLTVQVPPRTVRMSLVIDPAKDDELSWPLTMCTGHERTPWKNAICTQDLPPDNEIASRGGWLGALYPREAWLCAGVPTPELFIRGEDEEYPWKVRHAGFNFVTIRHSELEHPSAAIPLVHFTFGGHSFFYEPGLPVSRSYYKVRNWAWLQRLKRPTSYLHRLAACIFYIILSIVAMLQTNELTFNSLYTLFRAMHNGFYGKLRPFSKST